jgi:hypothetical protein
MPATIAPSGLISPVRWTAKYWIGGIGGLRFDHRIQTLTWARGALFGSSPI